MITIYGIKSCDTMQKAVKWLQANGLAFTFHDYRESGIDKATLEIWLNHFPVEKLVNLRSTTYKELTDDEKTSISTKPKALTLMMKYNTVIKRPVWDFGDGRFFLGWDEKALNDMINKK